MKKVMSIFLAAMLFISISPAVFAQSSDWAIPYIQKAEEMGVVNWMTKDMNLKEPATRIETAKQLVALYEKLAGKSIAVSANSFKDTDDITAEKVNSVGIMNGLTSTSFCPNEYMRRDEVFGYFYRLLISLYPLTDQEPPEYMFMDNNVFDDALLLRAARYLYYQKILYGVISTANAGEDAYNRKMKPASQITREELIALSIRVLENADLFRKAIGVETGWNASDISPTETIIEDFFLDHFEEFEQMRLVALKYQTQIWFGDDGTLHLYLPDNELIPVFEISDQYLEMGSFIEKYQILSIIKSVQSTAAYDQVEFVVWESSSIAKSIVYSTSEKDIYYKQIDFSSCVSDTNYSGKWYINLQPRSGIVPILPEGSDLS